VLEVKDHAVEQVSTRVRELMVGAGSGALSVPLEVDVGLGHNWDEAH